MAKEPNEEKPAEPVNLAMPEIPNTPLPRPTFRRPAKAEPKPQETPEPEPVPNPEDTKPEADVPTDNTLIETSASAELSSPTAEPAEDLPSLAEAATRGRLSPAAEERATLLMKEHILAGEYAAAFAAMPKLPWILSIRAVEQPWPNLTPEQRTALLEALAAEQGEIFIRIRLSLARSLARIELPTGLNLAGAACRSLWDSDKGALTAEQSKLIGNVLLGRGKPWVLQLDLKEAAPEDALPIASCVLFSAFNVNTPPITQLSILRYAAAQLPNIHPALMAMIARVINRWGGRWKNSLRKEIPDLPEALATAVGGEKPEPVTETSTFDDEENEPPLPPELEEKIKLAQESGDAEAIEFIAREVNAWRAAQETQAAAAAEEENDSPESTDREVRRRRGKGEKERPAYVSREQEAATRSSGNLNFPQILKQLESYVNGLRNDLNNAQSKLRRADEEARRSRRDRTVTSATDADLRPDELRRVAQQLEARNAELNSRVEELLADSETRALAAEMGGDALQQLRTLLALKLQEDYDDFIALENGAPDLIVQQHYRSLIRHVFAVLLDEGIPFARAAQLPPPPPEPLLPPPSPTIDPSEESSDDEEDDDLDQKIGEPSPEESEEAPDLLEPEPALEDETPAEEETEPETELRNRTSSSE